MTSNREHHLTFFLDSYRECAERFGYLVIHAQQLINELSKAEKWAVALNENRIENASNMGVPLDESNQVYNIDAVIEGAPEMAKAIREYYKKQKIELPDFVG